MFTFSRARPPNRFPRFKNRNAEILADNNSIGIRIPTFQKRRKKLCASFFRRTSKSKNSLSRVNIPSYARASELFEISFTIYACSSRGSLPRFRRIESAMRASRTPSCATSEMYIWQELLTCSCSTVNVAAILAQHADMPALLLPVSRTFIHRCEHFVVHHHRQSPYFARRTNSYRVRSFLMATAAVVRNGKTSRHATIVPPFSHALKRDCDTTRLRSSLPSMLVSPSEKRARARLRLRYLWFMNIFARECGLVL